MGEVSAQREESGQGISDLSEEHAKSRGSIRIIRSRGLRNWIEKRMKEKGSRLKWSCKENREY